MKKRPKERAPDKVILPLDGRPDGLPAESVFSDETHDDIAMIGEVFRKLTHLGAISIPLGFYYFGNIILYFLAGTLLASIIADLIRLFGGAKSKLLISRYLGIMIRPHESKNFTGATYILASSLITILLFDKPIAVMAIAFIVVGDTAGAIIGRIWGKVKFRGKSLEGSISFFFACTIVIIIVPGIPFWIKISGALAATITEAFAIWADDNLIVPIVSGAIMQLMVSQSVILEYFS